MDALRTPRALRSTSVETPFALAVEEVEAIAPDAEARVIVHLDPRIRRHDHPHEFLRQTRTRRWTTVTGPSGSTISTRPVPSPSPIGDQVDVVRTDAGPDLAAVRRRHPTSARSIEQAGETTRSRRVDGAGRRIATGSSPATRRIRRRTRSPAGGTPRAAARPARRPVAHHRDARAERHRLLLIVRDVDHRRGQPPVQQRQLGARRRRAAAGRGSRAARRAGTPAARARWRGRARRAAAGRPTAAPACDRAAPRCRARRPSPARARRSRAASTRRIRSPNARFSRTLLCG